MLLRIFKRNLSDARLYQCYTILKVTRRASPEDIRESFYKLSKIFHPDNVKTGNHHRFLRLKEAYELIREAPLKVDKSTISKRAKVEGEGGDDEDIAQEDLTHHGYIEYRRAMRGELMLDAHSEPQLYSNPHDSLRDIMIAFKNKRKFRTAFMNRHERQNPDGNNKKGDNF